MAKAKSGLEITVTEFVSPRGTRENGYIYLGNKKTLRLRSIFARLLGCAPLELSARSGRCYVGLCSIGFINEVQSIGMMFPPFHGNSRTCLWTNDNFISRENALITSQYCTRKNERRGSCISSINYVTM